MNFQILILFPFLLLCIVRAEPSSLKDFSFSVQPLNMESRRESYIPPLSPYQGGLKILTTEWTLMNNLRIHEIKNDQIHHVELMEELCFMRLPDISLKQPLKHRGYDLREGYISSRNILNEELKRLNIEKTCQFKGLIMSVIEGIPIIWYGYDIGAISRGRRVHFEIGRVHRALLYIPWSPFVLTKYRLKIIGRFMGPLHSKME